MKLQELTREQKIDLKQGLIVRRLDEQGMDAGYSDLAEADELVTDEELEAEFGDTEFTEDDFSAAA